MLGSMSLMVRLEIESFSRRIVRTVAGEGFENDDEGDETLATSSAESVANATPPRLTRPEEVSTETAAPARSSGGGGEESSRVSSRSRGMEKGNGKLSFSSSRLLATVLHFFLSSFSFRGFRRKTND